LLLQNTITNTIWIPLECKTWKKQAPWKHFTMW